MLRDGEVIQIQDRYYVYSAAEDTFYPAPTDSQYDFQRFVIFISVICLIAWICSVILER